MAVRLAMGALPKMKLSVEEYLILDRQAERNSEYHDGELFPIIDATRQHSSIAFNLGMVFGPRLRNSGCQGLMSPLRLRVSPTKYVFPDFIIVCGKAVLTDEHRDTITNPKVILEILSPSTADYDHGGKFELYRMLPSLEEYLLVSQDKPLVEIFRKQSPNDWSLQIVSDFDALVRIHSLGIEFPLGDLHEGIEFE